MNAGFTNGVSFIKPEMNAATVPGSGYMYSFLTLSVGEETPALPGLYYH